MNTHVATDVMALGNLNVKRGTGSHLHVMLWKAIERNQVTQGVSNRNQKKPQA